MKTSREKVLALIMVAAAAVLAAAGFLMLPDTLVVQVGMDGQASNTLPKLPALLIPFAMTAVFSVSYAREGATNKTRDLIVAVAGLGVAALMFIVNYAG